jgi:6,7-dimethyl-8-ribityllumazine synthase
LGTGAFEIPTVAMRLARSKKFDAIVCLGTVIRGDTPHFDFIASEAAKGIASVSMQTGFLSSSVSSPPIRWSRRSSAPAPRGAIKARMRH